MRMMGLLCAGLAVTVALADGQMARGVVFDDENGNGQRDAGEAGIADVRVSNGREIVRTDKEGKYALPVDDDTIIFITKPRNWMTPVNELNLPKFYYIHKPAGSPSYLKYEGVAPTGPLPASVDFPLRKRPEPDKFQVILFGDPQPYSLQEVDWFAEDVVSSVIGIPASFGMSLGDLVGDNLDLFAPYNRAIAHIGIPWYNVLGNHDMNFRAPVDKYSDETYERTYGPSYFSFDWGPVHFIVLDTVVWEGATEERRGRYHGGLGERQLAWVINDLKETPRDKLVVAAMHITLTEIDERKALLKELAKHPHTFSVAAHWHVQKHFFLGEEHDWHGEEPHHHLVHVTASGSWWRGAPDEQGIPHTTMRDGAPNGWSVATFSGNQYRIEFFPARRPADHQMTIYAPDEISRGAVEGAPVLVNVFAGSERSRVRMRVNEGRWRTLALAEEEDPFYIEIKDAEESERPPRGRALPKVIKSPHLWKGTLPAVEQSGTVRLEVETTDMFGQTYRDYRLIRVR